MDHGVVPTWETVPESLSAAWWELACLARAVCAPETLVDAFVACEVARLFYERDGRAWRSEEPTSYGPAQTRLAMREAAQLLARAAANALGPYALLSSLDERSQLNAETLGVGLKSLSWTGFDIFAGFDEVARELGLGAPPHTLLNDTTWRPEWTQR